MRTGSIGEDEGLSTSRVVRLFIIWKLCAEFLRKGFCFFCIFAILLECFPALLDRFRMNLDKFDLAILSVLRENARASLQDISGRVGLSSTPCWTRIKKMESEGVIQGYTVRIDPAALGFAETVIVQVTLENHNDAIIAAFGKALEEIPEVIDAYLISGDYDYIFRIAVRDTRDYERLLRERLYRIPGIRHSKSSFVLRRMKESAIPLYGSPSVPPVRRRRQTT